MRVCSIPALSCDNAVRMAIIRATFQQPTTANYWTYTQHCKHNHVLMYKHIHSCIYMNTYILVHINTYLQTCIYEYIFTHLYTYIQEKKETEMPSLIRYGPRRKIVEYPQLPAIRLVTHGEPEATDNWLILVVRMAIHTCPQPAALVTGQGFAAIASKERLGSERRRRYNVNKGEQWERMSSAYRSKACSSAYSPRCSLTTKNISFIVRSIVFARTASSL